MKILTQKYEIPENCHECHLFSVGKEIENGWREVEMKNYKQQFDPNKYSGICCHLFAKFMSSQDVVNRNWKPNSDEPCDYKILIESNIE
jgi:hypothetical protein